MDGTHGFGHGVTGVELSRQIAARRICPGCVGTRRQWCLHTRASVPCSLCSGGSLATHTIHHYAPIAALLPASPLTLDEAA